MQPTKIPQKKQNSFVLLKKSYRWLYHFYIRYLFKRDTIFATISVFFVIGLLGLMPLNTSILNPFKTALKDLDFNDISYSILKKNDGTPLDNRIVIVNIGDADRLGIALMLEKIRSAKPKVIGLDDQFEGPRDQQKDSALNHLIKSTPNLVIV